MSPMDANFGVWDLRLVLLSYIVASLASFTALDMAGRIRIAEGRDRLFWLVGGAAAMGAGIWSMHYIGMLALSMEMPVSYDIPVTLFSMFAAFLASILALFIVTRDRLTVVGMVLGGSIMGAGIATMHYTGMAAMRMPAQLSYHMPTFWASIAIAVAASMAALWLAFTFSRGGTIPVSEGVRYWLKIAAAAVMGVAVIGMHYTGMAAARFNPVSDGRSYVDLIDRLNIGDTFFVGVVLGLIAAMVLGTALGVARLKMSEDDFLQSLN